MSAVIAEPSDRVSEPAGMGQAVRCSVDVLDAAARLESRGFGDTAARNLGHENVFELAERLLTRVQMDDPIPLRDRSALGMTWALGRMLVLLAGVVISLAALPAQAPASLVFLAGAVGWLVGQTVSAGIWQGLGSGSRQAAASIAVVSAPVLLGAVLVVCVLVDFYPPILWALWALNSSVLVILRPGLRVVLLSLGSAGLVLAASIWLPAQPGLSGSAVAVLVIGFTAAQAGLAVREAGGRWQRPSRAAVAAQVMGFLQAGGQIVLLAAVLGIVGPEAFVAVAVAGLLAGAIADPVLELAYAGVRHVVAHPTSWRSGRVWTALTGIAGVLVVVAAASVCAFVLESVTSTGSGSPIQLATRLVAGLTAGSGMLLRAGSAFGAMTLSLLIAAASVLGWLGLSLGLSSVVVLLVLALVSVLSACALAVRYLSHPSAW